MGFRYRLYQLMRGRYGIDETFVLISAIAILLAFLNIFLRSIPLQLIVYGVMLLAFLRAFSRNLPARQRENRFAKALGERFRSFQSCRTRAKADKSHIYKSCPQCSAVLRLPRRKGTHTTVCPRCAKEFRVHVR